MYVQAAFRVSPIFNFIVKPAAVVSGAECVNDFGTPGVMSLESKRV